MNTDQLEQMAWDAEDSGADVCVHRHESQDNVIKYIEIDGEEFLNEYISDELEARDFNNERMWRE